jgi:hypothetical protein
MTRDDICPECLRMALECREAGQGSGDRLAIAAALEAYVGAPARKAPAARGVTPPASISTPNR